MGFILSVARMTALEGRRAHLPWLAGLTALAVFLLSRFLVQVSILEASEISASVMAALIRVAAVFIAANFVVTSMAREAGDKVTDLLLSQPVPRWSYFTGKLLGYLLVACCTGLALSVPLWLIQAQGVPAWTASLLAELAVMTSLSLFCALTFSHSVAAITAIAAFYILSRSMQALQHIAAASLAHDPGLYDRFTAGTLNAVALILPGLDRMTLSSWLTTPPTAPDLGIAIIEALLYVMLLSAASLFDLYRKNY